MAGDTQADDALYSVLGVRTPTAPVQQDGQPATVPPAPPAGAPSPSPLETTLGVKPTDTRPMDTPPSDPNLPFLSRAFHSLYGAGSALAHDVVRDLTPTVALPGTAAPTPAPALTTPGPGGAPVVSTDVSKDQPFMAGIARGVEDVTNTVHRAYTYTTGSQADMDQLRQQQKQDNQQFDEDFGHSTSANLGRAAGQFLATSGPLGLVGRGISGAVDLATLPSVSNAVGDAARWVTGLDRAATTAGRGVQASVQGAATGAGAAAMTGQDAGTGAGIGAVLGPLGAVAGKVVDAARGYIPGITQTVADLAAQAQARGIFPDIGKFSSNPTVRIIADQMRKWPLGGGTAADLANRRTIQGQIISEMGDTSGADLFTPQVMRSNATRIGNDIDAVANRTTIDANPAVPNGPSLYGDLGQVGQDMTRYGLNPNDPRWQAINAVTQDITSRLGQNGQMSGAAYRSLTETGSPLDTLINSNDGTSQVFGQQIERALRNAFQRSAAPGDVQALGNALYQYRVMKTAQPLVEKGVGGDIPLSQFDQQVINQSRRYDTSNQGVAYTGGGAMGTLGDITRTFFGREPDSGTAARGLTAAGLLGHIGNVATLGIPTIANAALQRFIVNNPEVQRRMVQTSLGAAVPDILRYVRPTVTAGNAYGNQTVPNQ